MILPALFDQVCKTSCVLAENVNKTPGSRGGGKGRGAVVKGKWTIYVGLAEVK